MSNRSVPFLAGALAAAVLVPFLSTSPQPAYAQQQGGAGTCFAVTAPGNGQGQNVLYVIDSDSMHLMVYEHRVGGQLNLTQVRNFEPETRFPEQWPPAKAKKQFPDVETIKKEVRKALKPK